MDVATAELRIAEILRDLEQDTGQIVESLSLCDMEITCVDSVRPEWLRRVDIAVLRRPGTRWVTK